MKIAIIGCGYVGSALGKSLAESAHDVVGTSTSASRLEELRGLGIKPELLDIANVNRLHKLLSDREVVYLTIAPGRHGADYRDVYLAAAKNLIKAAKDTTVRRIIYTGSTRVYAQDDGSWVDESSPTEPKDENGRALVATEQALLGAATQPPGATALQAVDAAPTDGNDTAPLTQQCHPMGKQRIAATVLRLGGIYGPSRDFTERIRSLAGTERADGDCYLNLIHLDHIVEALVALSETAHHGVLNLVADDPVRRSVLYDRVLREADLAPIRWVRGKEPTSLGKRVRNDLIKRVLSLNLEHLGH